MPRPIDAHFSCLLRSSVAKAHAPRHRCYGSSGSPSRASFATSPSIAKKGIEGFYRRRRGRGPTVMTAEVTAEVQELLDLGRTRRAVAEAVGVQYDTVRNAIDRRSAGLSAEPVVGPDGVPRRSENSDRQRPIGTDDSALDGGSQQLAVLRASPGSRGSLTVVQHRQQCPSSSSGDRRLPGGCVAQSGRRPAEPSCGPRIRLGVPGRSSAGSLGLGASPVGARGTRRGSAARFREKALAACECSNSGPRQQSGPLAALSPPLPPCQFTPSPVSTRAPCPTRTLSAARRRASSSRPGNPA